MLICFFDQKGIVHKERVPPGQTVNAAFYVEVLKRLRENVRWKRLDQWRNNTWLLHHNKAPAHAALMTRRFLIDNNMTVVPHPPYSPDLVPRDIFYFQKWKWSWRGEDFRRCRKFKQSHRRPEHATRKWLPRMLQKLAAPWGSLSSLRGGLLWRWCRPLMPKVSFSVF